MKTPIKNFLITARGKIRRFLNGLGSQKKCYVCNRTFSRFTKFRKGTEGRPEFRNRLKIIGSDIDNFGCMYCHSTDRERHLFMFFDVLGLWGKMKGATILHFAPEQNLSIRISNQSPLEYIKADLYPNREDITVIDATTIPLDDGTFDFIIANHILEHIPDYSKALHEFHRVLKPGGIAILQTPYSSLLRNNFEDENINTDELREFFYGQEDHVRVFGEYQLGESIEAAGFTLQTIKHDDLFDDHMAYYYGVNSQEAFTQALKPTDF